MEISETKTSNSSGNAVVTSSTPGGLPGADEDGICDGKYVVVERGDQQRIILFKSNQTITFGKGSTQQDILLKGASGTSFLNAFKASPAPPEVIASHKPFKDNSKPWKKSNKARPQNLFVLERSAEPIVKSINEFYQLPDTISSGTDNRNIHDDNSSQAMKKHDIISLREQGVSSKEILDTIITSSKSFNQKTEFAQEKYLKKKEKIYGDVLVFRKPSISILSDYYFKRDPVKILGLRPDTLSQLLSYANIHAHGKYLIFENCCGLIVAAVLNRLGGYGAALHCHIGSNPQRQALVCMNFTEEDLKPMMNLDMLYLLRGSGSNLSVEKGDADVIQDENITTGEETESLEEPQAKKQKLESGAGAESDPDDDKNGKDSCNENEQSEMEEETTFVTSRKLRASNNREDNETSLAFFNETEFDGLIICGKEHPLTLLQRLLPRLALSTPFVIYCQHPEPLMDCYVWVKEKGIGANVYLVDNWFRNIQVETERTHPEINMSPSGGYLLFGTYIGT
ncbi:unnamed protein product [Orchesella dallaii]|uniref:tRNA (adenine(58)-N(1))-methyltransferase non-catalytic subunit TRM6 n=1 Tax=Orchesella dallaii TaxID=48710 RepID=A0ABP1QA13_9HEXA